MPCCKAQRSSKFKVLKSNLWRHLVSSCEPVYYITTWEYNPVLSYHDNYIRNIYVYIYIYIYMFTYLRSGLVGISGAIFSSVPPNCSCICELRLFNLFDHLLLLLHCEEWGCSTSLIFYYYLYQINHYLRSDVLGWSPRHRGQSTRMINLCHFGSRLIILGLFVLGLGSSRTFRSSTDQQCRGADLPALVVEEEVSGAGATLPVKEGSQLQPHHQDRTQLTIRMRSSCRGSWSPLRRLQIKKINRSLSSTSAMIAWSLRSRLGWYRRSWPMQRVPSTCSLKEIRSCPPIRGTM